MVINKKGIGQEIDWILGVGLFLISIIFIFIVFRPGITPVYDAKTLLDIVQDGFIEDISWNITTVPIFVYPANSSYFGERNINLTNKQIDVSGGQIYTFDTLKNLLSEKSLANMELFYINKSYTDINVPPPRADNSVDEICGDQDLVESYDDLCEGVGRRDAVASSRNKTKKFEKGGEVNFYLEDNNIIFSGKLSNSRTTLTKTKYLFQVSSQTINFAPTTIVSPILNACAVLGNATYPYANTVSTSCPILYELGLTETISGISLPSFILLNETTDSGCTAGYECVKEKWKFPQSKEFTITIESLAISAKPPANSNRLIQEFNYTFPANAPSPPNNANVFVRQFNSFVLTDDGTELPVVVRIKSW